MHILLIADGRSPITYRWIQGLVESQHRITLVSTYPCADIPGVEARYTYPAAFGRFGGSQVGAGAEKPLEPRRSRLGALRGLVIPARYLLGPYTLPAYGRRLRRLIANLRPDLVHALRIPFEGLLGAYTPPGVPLVLSIWGNDLTLHARRNENMGLLTARALARANGLMADARRDIRLGIEWGFPADRPTLVVPGSGGIRLDEIDQARGEPDWVPEPFAAGVPLVINPRGFRPGSVRNEVFFQSIPLILNRRPETVFLCPGMAGQAEALHWVQQLKLEGHVRLMPYLTQAQLWDLFFHAQVSISLSAHDGTPNSLLEAMACGCFPIAGDIESLREWITPGVNGLLVEPDKPHALAEAVLLALEHADLRAAAAEWNRKRVTSRAEAGQVRARVENFYQSVLEG